MSLAAYWSVDPADLLNQLASSGQGLTSADAEARLAVVGLNQLREHRPLTRTRVLLSQLRSPLLLLLLFAAGAALLTREWVDRKSVV